MSEAIHLAQGRVLRSAFPWMSSLFAISALAFSIAAFGTREIEFVALLSGSILAALVCFPKLKPGKRFQLVENGIAIDQGSVLIPWDQIDSCALDGYKVSPSTVIASQSKPVTISYGENRIRLLVDPPNSNEEFYRGLWNLLLSSCQPNLSEPLATAYSAAAEKYGADRVVAAGPMSHSVGVRIPARVLFGVSAFFLAATVGVGIGGQQGVAIGFAVIAAVVLALLFSLFIVERVRSQRRMDGGGIVMTPQQLSLQIKNLKGSMKWGDLNDVALTPSATKPIRLRFRVAGADIVIDDQFQLPLWFLCERAQFLKDNYQIEFQKASSSKSPPAAEVAKVREDFNPYRPPRNS